MKNFLASVVALVLLSSGSVAFAAMGDLPEGAGSAAAPDSGTQQKEPWWSTPSYYQHQEAPSDPNCRIEKKTIRGDAESRGHSEVVCKDAYNKMKGELRGTCDLGNRRDRLSHDVSDDNLYYCTVLIDCLVKTCDPSAD